MKSLRDVAKFYDAEADTYESSRFSDDNGSTSSASHRDIIDELLAIDEADIILEIGAGTGRISRHLRSRGASVIGLDISVDMLRKARQQQTGALMVLADAGCMPIAGHSVDAVVGVNVVSHAPNFEQICAEVSRVLKPGGVFLFNYINASSYVAPVGWYVNWAKRGVRRRVYTRWYAPRGVDRALAALGFRRVARRGQAHVPPNLPAVIKRLEVPLNRGLRTAPFDRWAQVHWVLFRKAQ